MKHVIVNIIDDLSNVANLQELMQQEFAVAGKWKQEGILEHLLVKEDKHGAVLILKDVNETKAKELVATLPLFKYFIKVEYISTEKNF